MRIQCNAIKLDLKVRGSPEPTQHGVLEFVRSLDKRKRRPAQGNYITESNSQHAHKSYARNF